MQELQLLALTRLTAGGGGIISHGDGWFIDADPTTASNSRIARVECDRAAGLETRLRRGAPAVVTIVLIGADAA
jgi:hypothetical protein